MGPKRPRRTDGGQAAAGGRQRVAADRLRTGSRRIAGGAAERTSEGASGHTGQTSQLP